MATQPNRLRRDNLGFLLAKAAQRWNELLHARFRAAGFGHVRPAYGSILIPLFEADGLRIGELARRAGLSKQAMTTMLRQMEAAGLVERRPDPADGRASRIHLTAEARRFRPVAEQTLGELERAAARITPPGMAASLHSWLEALMQLRR